MPKVWASLAGVTLEDMMRLVPEGGELPGHFSWRKANWNLPSPCITGFRQGIWIDMDRDEKTGLDGNAEYLASLNELWSTHLAEREPTAPTVASLFAGCGGSSLGWSAAGFREVLAVEWDEKARETFALNFPDVPIWGGDIRELSVEEFMGLASIKAGELDVLDGSPPCQGFSTAGKREYADVRNQLYNDFVRLLEGARPKAFVMENVSGMVKGKMKLLFADATRKLKAAGYRVSCRLLDASWLGVPQSRRRLIWIGIREDLEIDPAHPDPLSYRYSLRDAIGDLLPGVAGQTAPFERSEWLAACKNDLHENSWRSADEPAATATANRPPVARFDIEAVGGGYMKGQTWDDDSPLGASRVTRPPTLRVRQPKMPQHRGRKWYESSKSLDVPCWTVPSSTAPILYAANSGRDGRPVEDTEPSPPVTTRPPRVAGRKEDANPVYELHRGMGFDEKTRGAEEPANSVRAAGPPELRSGGKSRPLTVRECARVQSFPDEFQFAGESKAAQYKQIGNAVPPVMMKAVAQKVKEALA